MYQCIREGASLTVSRSDAWHYALRVLSAADRSAHELRIRLEARGETAATIETTLTRLHRAGFLDDARVAANAAQVAVRRGHGSERVRAQLTARGIAATLIERAITAFDDETHLARAALTKRYRSAPRTAPERAKAARFLLQRGFPIAIVESVLGEE